MGGGRHRPHRELVVLMNTFTGHWSLLGRQRATGQTAEHHITAGQVPRELNWLHREIIKNNLTFTFTVGRTGGDDGPGVTE